MSFLPTGQWVCYIKKIKGTCWALQEKVGFRRKLWVKRRCSWLNLIYAFCRTLITEWSHHMDSSPTATAEKIKGTGRNHKWHVDSGGSGWVGCSYQIPERGWCTVGAFSHHSWLPCCVHCKMRAREPASKSGWCLQSAEPLWLRQRVLQTPGTSAIFHQRGSTFSSQSKSAKIKFLPPIRNTQVSTGPETRKGHRLSTLDVKAHHHNNSQTSKRRCFIEQSGGHSFHLSKNVCWGPQRQKSLPLVSTQEQGKRWLPESMEKSSKEGFHYSIKQLNEAGFAASSTLAHRRGAEGPCRFESLQRLEGDSGSKSTYALAQNTERHCPSWPNSCVI